MNTDKSFEYGGGREVKVGHLKELNPAIFKHPSAPTKVNILLTCPGSVDVENGTSIGGVPGSICPLTGLYAYMKPSHPAASIES